ncbi:MAG: zinc-binding dehydrogenase [Chloroflexi bacterium]|nr:zinc-binding dehydrogenase [Chloroflexota bacterium]
MTAVDHKVIVNKFDRNIREALEVVEVPYEAPAANEIRVRNLYAGVSVTDLLLVAGRSVVNVTPPFDLGVEAAGEVVEVGSDVRQFKPGDQVITAIYGNGFRQYSNIDTNLALLVSRATPELLALAMSGTTASIALDVVLKLHSGQIVLVTNAGGSTGHFAVQLARLAGNRVIGVVQGETQAGMVRALNCCERVIDLSREDLDVALRREYPNGVHVVYESMGGSVFDICLRHLTVRGRIVSVATTSDQFAADTPHHLLLYEHLVRKSATLYGFALTDYAQFVRTQFDHLLELYYADKLKVVIDTRVFMGLASVPDALEHLLAGKNAGKIIVRL